MLVAAPDSGRVRILLVEDDDRLAKLVSRFLEGEGFAVAVEGRGDAVAARVQTWKPDLIVLDIMLPGKNGFDVCREVRTSFKGPIAMLTAKTEDVDEILGLELGADDYIEKPVKPRVLLARIRCLLRRESRRSQQEVCIGTLRITPGRREVELAEESIVLTGLEFDLLLLLARSVGEVVPRDFLHTELRGIEYDGIDRTIDLVVSRIRRKLGDASLIKTVRGSGYLLVADR